MNETFYSVEMPITNEGFESTSRVVLLGVGVQDSDSFVLFETESLLQDDQVSSFLLRADQKFTVAVLPDTKVPVICLKNSDATTDMTELYTLIADYLKEENLTELPQDCIDVLVDRLTSAGYTEEESQCLISASVRLYNYLNEDSIDFVVAVGVVYYDEEFLEMTRKVCKASEDAARNPFTLIDLADNKTLKQESCSDPLFIRLPTVQELLETQNMNVLLPRRFDVAQPYTYDEAYTPDYKDNKSSVPALLYPTIEGNSSCNGAPLYENEKVFHQSLLDWLQFTEKSINGAELSLTVSKETEELTSFQDKEQNVSLEVATVINRPAQEFIEALIGYLYRLHWSHNPNVPCSRYYDSDEDESDPYNENENESVDSSYTYRTAKTVDDTKVRINSLELLLQFLRSAALQCGCHIYADAIVQLARWQMRKPTALVIEGYPQMFLLGTGTTRTARLSIANSVAEGLPEVKSLILSDGELKDKSVFGDVDLWTIPVGVVTEVIFKSRTDNQTEAVQVYYHAVDFIREVVLKGTNLKGVKFENGKFVDTGVKPDSLIASNLIKSYRTDPDGFLRKPFFNSQEMKMFYIEYGAFSSTQQLDKRSLLALMDERAVTASLGEQITENKFKDLEDLNAKVARHEILSKSSAVEFAIIDTLIPVYLKAEENFSKYDLETASLADILNCWLQAMIDCDFVSEYGNHPHKSEIQGVREFCGFPPLKKETSEPVQKEVTQPKQEPAQVAPTAVPEVVLFRTPSADAVYNPIVHTINGNSFVMAYVAEETHQRPGKKTVTYYTIVSKSFVENCKSARIRETQYPMMETFTPLLLRDLYAMALHKAGYVRLFFENVGLLDQLLKSLAGR